MTSKTILVKLIKRKYMEFLVVLKTILGKYGIIRMDYY